MSLLMDALKKAEMAKRQNAAAAAGGSPANMETPSLGELSIEPIAVPTASRQERLATLSAVEARQELAVHARETSAASSPLPTLETEAVFTPAPESNPVVQGLQSEPATESLQAGTSARTPARTQANPGTSSAVKAAQDRRNAENLFQAKQSTHDQDNGKKRMFVIALGATTLSAMTAIGIYFWWQLQPRNNSNFASTSVRPLSQAPLISAPPAATVPVTPAAPAVAPAADGSTTSVGAAVPAPVQSARPTTPSRPSVAPGESEEDRPVRITRAPLKVNPALARAFDAAGKGDTAAAQKAYLSVLADDPQNTDALHGMTDLSLREGRLSDAERFLQRILLANPQDTVAIAGLTNLYARSNPAQAETRLKALATTQPDQAAPQIALGNLYSAQGRWQEAQQAYFSAYANQPDNPDLLFNLAITLEYLNQPRLAIQYYSEAQQAAKHRPASFGSAQIDERLRVLKP